jgi:hypothetical protein
MEYFLVFTLGPIEAVNGLIFVIGQRITACGQDYTNGIAGIPTRPLLIQGMIERG